MPDYALKGRGEPLLLHGIGSRRQMWARALDRVVAERDVRAIDLPGFGRSALLRREPTGAADAADAANAVSAVSAAVLPAGSGSV